MFFLFQIFSCVYVLVSDLLDLKLFEGMDGVYIYRILTLKHYSMFHTLHLRHN